MGWSFWVRWSLIRPIRSGGDRGLPVTLAGAESTLAGPFFEIAKKVAARAKEIAGASEEILEIS